MRKMMLTVCVLVVVAFLAAPVLAAEPAAPAAPAKPSLAPAAPAQPVIAKLKTYPDGKEFDPFAQKKPVVLVLTASSCSICQAELAALKDKLADIEKYADFYAVSEDVSPEKTLPSYLERSGFPFKFLMDQKFAFGISQGIAFTPATLVINKDKVVEKKAGYREGDVDVLLTTLKGLK